MNAQILSRHFSSSTIRSLAKKGIRIIGVQMVPGAGDMPWATAEVAYQVDDNSTGRVLTHGDLVALAN